MTVTPKDAIISADYLDFYVNGEYFWGIELLREGDRAEGHMSRFRAGDP